MTIKVQTDIGIPPTRKRTRAERKAFLNGVSPLILTEARQDLERKEFISRTPQTFILQRKNSPLT